MLSHLLLPSSNAHLFASGPSTDHFRPQDDIHAATGHQNNTNDGVASVAGQGTTSAPWALTSPFPEYVCIPALVHRSQLASFTASIASPVEAISPALSPQEQMGPTAQSGTSAAQRKTRGVKIACTNCRLANKRCDEGRPCERCVKNGLEHSCVSAERKRRRRTVRQTATAKLTLSTTQVSVETPLTSEATDRRPYGGHSPCYGWHVVCR
ncbi:hypothetical protein DICSQDRAFT_123664 [Dichomitus squalens LYAD-421 SS1]|uniref:uncharacterized protein n=1 Tax=Dichomitus squalens (strain LYAD-421) TaxID=732165 RepID=UPI0004410A2B|nr:uncharacterized protein DICSQDRAFT_123664 [Dichomitus squalens LYAD-421 SS1]EJF67261.1 hypothetical protein DICSQDRAFT_123664 [Dichomitus squalens LYAD-421 SS1]